MAQRRQGTELQQRVMQLVAEGEPYKAYELLVAENWVPRGFGYQETLPTGLKVLKQVDARHWVLISPSGRLWAWASQADSLLQSWHLKLQGMELPEIAQTINAVEGHAWYMQHDAAAGRIGADISAALREARNLVRIAAEVFAVKAGIDVEDYDAMRRRIQAELVKYEQLMEQRWRRLFQIGVVFSVISERAGDTALRFEVVGLYDARGIGPDQYVFVRVQGSGEFSLFDNCDVDRLRLVDTPPIYTNDPGFLRAVWQGEHFPDVMKSGNDIRETGAVFLFKGGNGDPRNGVWETFYQFTVVGSDGVMVIVARNHDRPCVAEFTATDLSKITVLTQPPKYIERPSQNCCVVPVLDIS